MEYYMHTSRYITSRTNLFTQTHTLCLCLINENKLNMNLFLPPIARDEPFDKPVILYKQLEK